MEKVTVQSRGVDWVAYDEDARVLVVSFGSFRTYRYFDVPPSVYEWLLRAKSKGTFINRLVRDRYRYERLGAGPRKDVDANLLAMLEKSLEEPR